MADCFRLTSLCLQVDDADARPQAESLLHPARHQPRISRVIFHETVHYWQYLAFGFIARLTVEELARLRELEDRQRLSSAGPVRQQYRFKHPNVGFSALDLQESLARYWDVHVIGPHTLLEMDMTDPSRRVTDEARARYHELVEANKLTLANGDYTDLAFDLAMEAGGGSYARPYQMVREQYPPAIAAGLFPLVGSIALNAERPAPFFVRLLRMAAAHLGEQAPRSIHDIWEAWYLPIQRLGMQLAEELGEALLSSVMVYQDSNLNEYPPHHFAAFEREEAIKALANSEDLAAQVPGASPRQLMHAGLIELERRLALPGDPTHRAFLSAWLSPPCLKLANGSRWLLGDAIRRRLFLEIDENERKQTTIRENNADEVLSLDDRWISFVKQSIKQFAGPVRKQAPRLPEDRAFLQATQALLRSARSQHTDYQELFLRLLQEFPAPGTPLASFIDRHVHLGRIRGEDIDAVNDMICIQLALRRGLTLYDADHGYEWQWDGQPVQLVLAAALGHYTSTLISEERMASHCAALMLRSLEIFRETAGVGLHPLIKARLEEVVELLSATTPSWYLEGVDVRIADIRARQAE